MFARGRRLTSSLSVAPQIAAQDFSAVAAAGFRSVINNRPDGESWGQLPDERAAEAARAAGLVYRYQPVVSGNVSDADAAAFGALLAELPQPVLAYCRSGTRCTMLWALSEAGKRPADEILEMAAQAGYDLSPLRPRLESAP